MPIEIKELVIKATIVDKNEGKAAVPAPKGDDRDELIADCVEQVIEIIKKQEER